MVDVLKPTSEMVKVISHLSIESHHSPQPLAQHHHPQPTSSPYSSPPYLSQIPVEFQLQLSRAQRAALNKLEWEFDVSKSKLAAIVDQFVIEFNRGLEKVPSPNDHRLPMIPTFIHDVPKGDEKGIFLALDLGGTNLRVCEVNLNGDKTFSIKSNKYKLSDQVKTGTAIELFDYISNCVEKFLLELGHDLEEEEKLHLGFTFSFPAHQTALDNGTLMSWTKGFEASGAIGNDVVKLLQDALDKRKLRVHCNALINDTTGTLMARAYQSGSAIVGAIFGTGTNGAYVENLAKIGKVSESFANKLNHNQHMIINTEWGAFDNDRKILPITKYDNKLDRESINPRKQAFEKQISGMYLGELTRNILVDLIDNLLLFDGFSSAALNQHYGLDTALMSAIELRLAGASDVKWLKATAKTLSDSLGVKASEADCVMVQRICEVVATRAARLSATALATIIQQTKPQGMMAVGVDGSVIEHYPMFEHRLRGALEDLFEPEVCGRLAIGLAKDGSGVGAALCALQAKKQAEEM